VHPFDINLSFDMLHTLTHTRMRAITHAHTLHTTHAQETEVAEGGAGSRSEKDAINRMHGYEQQKRKC